MKVTREADSSTEVTLNIEMAPEDEEPFLNRSYRRVVRELRVPGFRPGKAPRSRVESIIGREGLVHEALDFMIPETLDQVLKDENIEAFMEPRVELLDMVPVSFKAVVPLEPEVNLGDYQNIRVEKDSTEITEEQVDQVIERYRNESAPWEPVDRPLQFGDLANLNVTGTIEGEEVLNDEGVDFIPDEDNNLPFPGFSAQLEGMAEGQEKEFTLTVPEDYAQAEYAGKECHFKVMVVSIKAKDLPDLDDEFAKGVGEGYESMEALRGFVQGRLAQDAENQANRDLQEKALGELLQTATIQASDMLFQRELEMMEQERDRALRNQRLDMETYLSYIGQTQEEFREQLRPSADERLNRSLVLRKLAQEEGVEVTQEELEEEMAALVASAGESAEAMERALASENARESIRSSILNRKVMDRLARIVQGQAETVESGEGAAAVEAGTDTEEAAKPQAQDEGNATETTDAEGSQEGAKPHAD